MCGRIACTLEPDVYRKACSYYNSEKCQHEMPEWIDLKNDDRPFLPSTNVAPTQSIPVIVSGSKFEASSKRIIAPMYWGLVPRWHTDDLKQQKLSTFNCRIETLTEYKESKLFGDPMKEGKRCVVICDGFYEWQVSEKLKNKQPYFIYVRQDDDKFEVEEIACWEKGEWSSEAGWNGPKLLFFAGVYDEWKTKEGETVFSCSIVTRKSEEYVSWLHERMPAILPNEKLVEEWLDSKNVSADEAVSKLNATALPPAYISWHPVTMLLNNSRNKSDTLNKPIRKPNATALENWMRTGDIRRKLSDDSSKIAPKIPKF